MTFCRRCGRQLVEVVEAGAVDPASGLRRPVVWMQCPKFPRNVLMALLRFGALHDSYLRDMPLMGRYWR